MVAGPPKEYLSWLDSRRWWLVSWALTVLCIWVSINRLFSLSLQTPFPNRHLLLAEETRNAATTLPKSIMWSTYLNSILGLAMVITICYTAGDINEIRKTATGYPFIQIFYNATQSLAGTTIMTIIVILTILASAIAVTATASRQIWSFARDNGVPFSSRVSRVSWKSLDHRKKHPAHLLSRSLQAGTSPSTPSSSPSS
jgi:Amino acid permease